MTWATEGEKFDVTGDDHVYLSYAARQFLAGDGVLAVVGGKGMGKTLLLKAKRHPPASSAVERRMES